MGGGNSGHGDVCVGGGHGDVGVWGGHGDMWVGGWVVVIVVMVVCLHAGGGVVMCVGWGGHGDMGAGDGDSGHGDSRSVLQFRLKNTHQPLQLPPHPPTPPIHR